MPPTSDSNSVTFWIDRIKTGDPDAAKPLWDNYFSRLVSLARTRLRSLPRAVADEEDVALSAFDSFCRGAADGRFPRLDDRDDLWQVLFLITERKAIGQLRRETRKKRDVRRVAQPSATRSDSGTPDRLATEASPQPSPDFVAEVADECNRLLGLLESEGGDLQKVAICKMEGYSNKEIAKKIKRSEQTVERKLATIRKVWRNEVDPKDREAKPKE